jgi:uncharacterized protein (TIGR03435 family)
MNTFMLVLNSLWQGAAIAAVMWLVLRSMPRVNAATRYVVWWTVLLLVLLLPFAPLMIPRHNAMPGSPVASSSGAAVNPLLPDPAITAVVTLRPQPSSKWTLLVLVTWCAVFLYSLVRLTGSWLYVRAIKLRAKSCSQTLPAIGRHAGVFLSAEASSPMAVGFLKPAVILPESLPAELEPAELDHVLLHESAHLARFDDWTNLAGNILAGALALHPVALWILRQIEREREIACDEWVVARTGQAGDYAVSLARMCERQWLQQQPLVSGIFGRHSRIVQRIELLLKPGREFSPRVAISRIAWSCLALLALAAGTSRAPQLVAFARQSQRPSFEVASIKPGNPNERGPQGVGIDRDRLMVRNSSLKFMIQFAYGVQGHQILGGPKWIDSDLFSIDARPSAAMPSDEGEKQRLRQAGEARRTVVAGALKDKEITLANAEALVQQKQWTFDDFRRFLREAGYGPEEDPLVWLLSEKMGLPTRPILNPKMFPLMLQSLMEERFKLALHRETRMEPIYELVVAKGGPKLKESAGPDANGRFGFFCASIAGPCTSTDMGIGGLVGMLSRMLGRPVSDKTGLTGKYDYTLTFTPEPAQAVSGAPPQEALPSVDSNAPSIFTALQEQLGLKLESTRGPVEVLVIDNAARPDPN